MKQIAAVLTVWAAAVAQNSAAARAIDATGLDPEPTKKTEDLVVVDHIGSVPTPN